MLRTILITVIISNENDLHTWFINVNAVSVEELLQRVLNLIQERVRNVHLYLQCRD